MAADIQLSDERIIELYFQREEKALTATQDKYGKLIHRIAYNILSDRSDCEECENDCLLEIWNRIPPARPKVFPAFLTTLVRRTAISRYRQKTSGKRVPSSLTVSLDELDGILAGGETPEAAQSAEELGKLISEFVSSLSKRRQDIFIGRYYLSETLEFIASDLGMSVSGVHRELDRIKEDLKNHLNRNGVYV